MTKERIDLGKWGEDLASQLFEDEGWTILERNFRVRSGEIDIIAQKWEAQIRGPRQRLVFVEVKTRKPRRGTRPEDQVTHGKRKRLVRLARIFIKMRGLEHISARFDVVAIDWLAEDRYRLRHHKGAFDAMGRVT